MTFKNIIHIYKNTNDKSNVGSSETLRNESCFDYYWLAGLIEANGGFYISRQRYVSCEITMHEEAVQTLYYIKKYLGGTVQKRTGKKAYRWRLHKQEPIYKLLENINGKIQTSRVQHQYKSICNILKENSQKPVALLLRMHTNNPVNVVGQEGLRSNKISLETGWLSGFFSGDGSFSINIRAQYQPSVSISQAEKPILDDISLLVGGNVYYDKSWNGWIWWLDCRSNKDILSYFQKFPLRNPMKEARLKSILRFLGFLERGFHRDPKYKARLRHFVHIFQKNKQD